MPLVDPSILNNNGDPLADGMGQGFKLRDMINQAADSKKNRLAAREFEALAQTNDITTRDGLISAAKGLAQKGYGNQALRIIHDHMDMLAPPKPVERKYGKYEGENGAYLYNESNPKDIQPIQYDGQVIKPKTKPENMPKRELKVDKAGLYTSVDPGTGLDLNGNRVEAQPQVMLQQGPNGEVYTVNPRAAASGAAGAVKPVASPAPGGGQLTTKPANKAEFDALPKPAQEQISTLSTKMANKQMISNSIKSYLDAFDKAMQAGDHDTAIRMGSQALKTLNSPEGADAIGAEEANRLGGALQFKWGNLTDPGPFVGRDLAGFRNQMDQTRSVIDNGLRMSNAEIERLYGHTKGPKSHPQDSEAIRWAKSHSTDPRAAAILKANGVQ